MLLSVFLLALRSVQRNLLRSFLTILGIVIGVSAVITMVTLGNGATQEIRTQISGLGTNLLFIGRGQRFGGGGGGGVPEFTEADALAIQSQIGGVAAAAPTDRFSNTVVSNGRSWATNITGSTNAWFQTGNWKLASGVKFSDEEQTAGAAVCIVGETVRREIFGGVAGQTGLGEPLRIKQFSCNVIGILAAKGQSGMGDQDDIVLVPLHTLQRRITGNRKVSSLQVSMADGTDSQSLKAALTLLLRERRKLAAGIDDNFNIFDTQQLAETLSSTTRLMTTLLGAVAAVSLLVGGIGVMNIMLVSVTERTREIGIRMAIGARANDIMMQFLVEAVVLALIGGVAGALVGLGAIAGLGGSLGWPMKLDPLALGVAVATSALTGIAFGFFPARRAAKLDPIVALRHE